MTNKTIAANELRIGNWFCYGKNKAFEKVHWISYAIGEGHLVNGQIPFDHCYPIELTPEILEKAGFELQPQRISIWIKGRIKIWLGHNGAVAYLRDEDKDESYYIPNPVQNLHQLQNLFFCLTGEELPLTL